MLKLREAMLLYFSKAFYDCDSQVYKTAGVLGISARTVNNYRKECIKLGLLTPIKKCKITQKEINDKYFKIFPSNEYRLEYRDEMLNRDRLF